MRNNYLSHHVYFCKFIQVFLTYQTLVMAIGETFDLNQSDLLFLLQISDAVYTLPSEKQVFEYACRTYAAKAEVTEVVIYDLSKPGPELKSRFYHSDNGHNTIPQDIHCVAHFEMYRQQDGLCINDVTAHPDAPLFDCCHIRAVAGVLTSNYLLELRSPIRKNWTPSLINLLKSGFERVVKAAGRISELEQFRSRNFNFETTARAIMSLSAGQSGITGFRSQSEIENLKQALLRAALPGDVMPNITDEEIPRTEIEIARSFTREKDQQLGYQEAGRDNMHWVKLGSGQFGDAAGNPPFRATEMGTYEFTFSHEALIRDKQNQAFLLHLTDELSTVADPVEVQKKATEMLATYFNFSMAYYSMYNDGLWTTEWQYRAPGIESIVGNHHDDSHPLISSYLKEEKVFVSHNLAADNRLEPGERGVMQDLDVNAVVMAPIFTEGRLKGAFIAAQKQARHWSDDEISLIKEVARRTQGAVDHVLARKALRESEEKYRTKLEQEVLERTQEVIRLKDKIARQVTDKYYAIFNSIDEGFCIYELIYDGAGKPIDLKWIESNPAYEKQTGLKNITGKTHRELSLNTESYWLEIYDTVAKTGESVHFEEWHEPTGRWYNTFSSRNGNEGSNQVAVVFSDITERRNREQKQNCLLKLSDELRPLGDSIAITNAACRIIVEELNVNRAQFNLVEGDPGNETGIVKSEYIRSGKPMLRNFSLNDFGEAYVNMLRSGQTIVQTNIDTDALLTDEQRSSYRAVDSMSAISVPLVKDGRLVASFTIHSNVPRNWFPFEVELMEEIVERTWASAERARAEEALQISEEKYRSLFNSAGVGFCIIELIFEDDTAVDFRWLEVNPAYERQTGLNIQKGDLASEMSPGTENYWLEIYSRVAQTGEAVEFEQWHEPTRRWYDVSASKVGGEGSNQVAVIFDDITERKKAAEMQSFLLQLSDTLRNETSADAIAAQSLQMLYKYLQADHCCASMCLMEDDMLKVTHQVGNMNNIPPGISLSDFPDAVKTLLHGTCVIDDVLNASFLSDAEKQSFNAMGIGGMVISSIRKGPEYPICGIAAISVKPRTWTRAEIKLIEDVTERTWNAMERANTEAALHRNAERMRFLKEAYQSVVNFAPCQESLHILSRLVISETGGAARTAFYIANADHTELNTIKGGGNMDDAYADEIDGFSIGDDSLACGLAVPTGKPVITPDVYEEPRWKAWTFLAKKYNYRGCWSFPVKTKDNNAVGTFAMYFSDPRQATPNDMELAELVTSAAAVIISTHLEVQERIRAEKALAESRDKLRQNLVQQNEFLRIATHEVRTPLTVIKLTAQFLKNNLAATDGNESRLLLLDKLNTSVVKLIVLFEDLMQTTKVADGSLELRHAAFDIHALIADVIADQQSVAPERKIINRAEGVLQIEADKNRIEQVIINLLTNANKYSPGDAAIIIETRRMNEMIEVCVKDNGPGIPADEHEKIFKRFYRVKNPSGREGLGVGLYISDVIIKMHGGRIWVDSTTGSGSSFYFTLPLKQTKNI